MNGKSILITGGTGSFGKKFVTHLLKKYKKIKKLIIYSRDELKQFEMANVLSEKKISLFEIFYRRCKRLPAFTKSSEKC